VPCLVYQVVVFKLSAEFSTKATTHTPPPPFLDIAFSYGLLLFLAVAGAIAVRRERWLRLAALWALVTLAIIYAPPGLLPFGRKMIEGVHLPLCLLAAVGLVWLLRTVCKAPSLTFVRRGLAAAVVVVLSLSTLNLLSYGVTSPGTNEELIGKGVQIPPLRLSRGDAAALKFLAGPDVSRDRAVLCLGLLGNYVPPATGHYVYIGHWAETLDYNRKLAETGAFFTGRMPESFAREWLRKNRIGYVIGGGGLKLSTPLKEVFQEGDTTVYEVPD
jgi:hypothetical protein